MSPDEHSRGVANSNKQVMSDFLTELVELHLAGCASISDTGKQASSHRQSLRPADLHPHPHLALHLPPTLTQACSLSQTDAPSWSASSWTRALASRTRPLCRLAPSAQSSPLSRYAMCAHLPMCAQLTSKLFTCQANDVCGIGDPSLIALAEGCPATSQAW